MEEEAKKILEKVAAASGEHIREIARDLGADWGEVEDLAAAMAQSAIGHFGSVYFSETQEKRFDEALKDVFNCEGCDNLNPPALCRLTFKLWGLTPPCDWR